ncbi:MAG TPA: DUF4276 family protein [Telluria sp.]|nr:DUF4276 family protein [Telluria sp.]
MITVVSIVEGDGEVRALPVLLRRINGWLTPSASIFLPNPIRVRKDQFLRRADVFERHVKLAARICAQPGWILILLDADDDCPKELAEQTLRRARLLAPHRMISVVLANREYEAWFIAAAASLDGKRGFSAPAQPLPAADAIRDAKGWIDRQIVGGKYHPIDDQAAFSAQMDLSETHANSRSFRKLCDDWTRQNQLSLSLP